MNTYEELPLSQNTHCYYYKGLTVALAPRHLNSIGGLNLTGEEYATIALMIDLTLDSIEAKRCGKEKFDELLEKCYS